MPGAYLLNQITAATTLTSSSEDAVYPVENLYGEIASKVFRSESQTTLTILVDFGTPITCTGIGLVNHNLTPDASVVLSWLTTDSPAVEITLATPAWRALDMWGGFPEITAQSWLIEITDTNSANIQIGQLLLGYLVNLPRARKIGGYTPGKENSNISSETYGGSKYVNPLNKRRKMNPTFRVLGTEIDIFEALDDAVDGDARPFLYIPDSLLAPCYYVRKETSFDPSEFDTSEGGQIVHDYTMSLIEESRGLEIAA